MKMRKLLIALTVLHLLAVAGLAGLKGTRPNIVFFLADDQSLFDHTTYGTAAAPTPVTDAFGEEGLVFEKAFTGQAICAPSRSMLYSGLYPIRNGCFINHTSIRPGIKTLPDYLKPLGYDVILAGKSHVRPAEQFQWTQTFQPVQHEGLPRPSIPLEEMDAYMAKANGPFCMIVASEYPHGPYFEESPFAPEDVSLPPFRADNEQNRNNAIRYYASIAEKEREFAAVLKLLEKHGFAEDSIVFYSDDHGASRGKFTVYDSGLNVAFMVRWPGKIQPGRTAALTSFADFVPTVMELAGGEAPKGLDGKSMLPVLQGHGKQHDYVYGVTHNQGIQNRHVFPQRSVHDGRYHYIYNSNSNERVDQNAGDNEVISYFLKHGANKHPGQPVEQLYDTEKDPHEMTNRARDPELASVKARLKKELFRWMKSQNDYLTENGPVRFLKVRMHDLDQQAPKFNYEIPEELVDSLKGMKRDPHKLTAGNK
ncbi:MAG: sulfatase [Puniceicoccaceae bacterium]